MVSEIWLEALEAHMKSSNERISVFGCFWRRSQLCWPFFDECDLYFVISYGDLRRRPGEAMKNAYTELLCLFHKRLSRVSPGYHVPFEYGLET